MSVEYEEDCICLYKGDEVRTFSKHEVEDALDNGWRDNPADAQSKPPKTKAAKTEMAAETAAAEPVTEPDTAAAPQTRRRRAAVAE